AHAVCQVRAVAELLADILTSQKRIIACVLLRSELGFARPLIPINHSLEQFRQLLQLLALFGVFVHGDSRSLYRGASQPVMLCRHCGAAKTGNFPRPFAPARAGGQNPTSRRSPGASCVITSVGVFGVRPNSE